MVATLSEKPLPSRADRIWNLGESLWSLALPALIVLKLTGVIGWSWWWVALAPLWIGGSTAPFRFDLPGIGARIWNLGQRLAPPALIVLKLTGVIAWSWWWVLAPVWLIGLVVLLLLCRLVHTAARCSPESSRTGAGSASAATALAVSRARAVVVR